MSELDWLLNVTSNDISVIYVTAHRCAGRLVVPIWSGSQRKTNYLISSNSHPSPTANKAIHSLKWEGFTKPMGMKHCIRRPIRKIIPHKGLGKFGKPMDVLWFHKWTSHTIKIKFCSDCMHLLKELRLKFHFCYFTLYGTRRRTRKYLLGLITKCDFQCASFGHFVIWQICMTPWSV